MSTVAWSRGPVHTLDDVNNERIARQKGAFLENLDAVEVLSPETLADYSPAIRNANLRFAESGAEILSLYEVGRIQDALELHLLEEHPISHEIESEVQELIGESRGEMDFSLASLESDQ